MIPSFKNHVEALWGILSSEKKRSLVSGVDESVKILRKVATDELSNFATAARKRPQHSETKRNRNRVCPLTPGICVEESVCGKYANKNMPTRLVTTVATVVFVVGHRGIMGSLCSFWRKFGLQKAKEHHDQEIVPILAPKHARMHSSVHTHSCACMHCVFACLHAHAVPAPEEEGAAAKAAGTAHPEQGGQHTQRYRHASYVSYITHQASHATHHAM